MVGRDEMVERKSRVHVALNELERHSWRRPGGSTG